jgi:hypothetical protein
MAPWLAHRSVPHRIRERKASATEQYRKTTTVLSVEPTPDMSRGAQYTNDIADSMPRIMTVAGSMPVAGIPVVRTFPIR